MVILHQDCKPNPAHTHLSTKNILVSPSDFKIFIADYGLRSLKKFCKLFAKYHQHNAWSAPEVWRDPQLDFSQQTSVDVYSFGIILWELEKGQVPFDTLDDKVIRHMLLEERVRPMIPEGTDKALSTIIRRCWQDNEMRRPEFKTILSYLDKVTFS